MDEVVRTVRLSSLRGRLARYLMGSPLLAHNGVPIDEYPERDWNLVCFPAQKGRPFDADNLATVMGHTFLGDPAFIAARRAAEARWPGDRLAPRRGVAEQPCCADIRGG